MVDILRTRVNPQKFEGEISTFCEKKGACMFSVRLRTPQSRLSNVKNIADFILFAASVVILEVKETSASSFSLKDIQQREKLDEFKEFYAQAKKVYGSSLPYRVVVLVHFIKLKKYTAYFIDDGEYKIIRPDDADCITASTLKEIMEKII